MSTSDFPPQLHGGDSPAATPSATLTAPTTLGRVLRLLASLLVFGAGAYVLGYEITGEWSAQWDYTDLFHNPYGPRGPLPSGVNAIHNVAIGTAGIVGVLAGLCGALYQLASLRRARRGGD